MTYFNFILTNFDLHMPAARASSEDSIEPAGDQGYDNMLRYLQPHAPANDRFKEIIGARQTAEAMHFIMDQMLPFKRLHIGPWNPTNPRSSGT
jgi:hypothetical protein